MAPSCATATSTWTATPANGTRRSAPAARSEFLISPAASTAAGSLQPQPSTPMPTIKSPRRVTTPRRKLHPRLHKLEAQRVATGLSAEESRELDLIYREIEQQHLSESDVDRLAEEHAEARRPHHHDLPIARNFHD